MREEAIAGFDRRLRGSLVRRDHPEYDRARAVFNGSVDRRPLLIARCADEDDVSTAVKFGCENGLRIAVRGGGHSAAGFGVCDDGLVIDQSLMRRVRVDASDRTVLVDAGCTQGEVDAATRSLGLAVPCGVFPDTGLAGLTLGGGHGYLSRKYGLTIDNLIAARVVLADGTLVTASATENPDLFWALRGGGGNFGAVTRFVLRACPVGIVNAGPILWDAKDGRRVVRWYRDFLPSSGNDLYAFLSLQTVPAEEPFRREAWGAPAVALVFCCHGSPADRQRIMNEIRSDLPLPLFDGNRERPFHDLQDMGKGAFAPGLHWYWKGALVTSISDAALELYLEEFTRAPNAACHVHFYPIDGAVHRVGKNDTAWNCRNASWSLDIAAVDADPAKTVALKKWAQSYFEAIRPFTLAAGYVNFMMNDEDEARVRATYGDNYPRLELLKRKYDPGNAFRLNQNIRPAA